MHSTLSYDCVDIFYVCNLNLYMQYIIMAFPLFHVKTHSPKESWGKSWLKFEALSFCNLLSFSEQSILQEGQCVVHTTVLVLLLCRLNLMSELLLFICTQ